MLKISNRFFILAAGIFFLGEGLMHGIRAFQNGPGVLGMWEIPIWASWAIAGTAFIMALTALRILK